MIDKIIGFIGAGNMGSAMIGGIVHSELVTTSQIIASAHSAATLETVSYTHLDVYKRQDECIGIYRKVTAKFQARYVMI